MTTITTKIAAANYVATGAQVEQLAASVVQGNESNGTYLRVLTVACQSQLGKAPRGRRPKTTVDVTVAQDECLKLVHDEFYVHVLKGVSEGAQLDKREQHRRAAFARSAAATLRAFIRGGGDVRTLKVEEVSKGGLRKAVAPPEPRDKVQRQIQRSEGALIRALQRLGKVNPVSMARRVEQIVLALDELAPVDAEAARETQATTTMVGHRLHRVPAGAFVQPTVSG